MVGIEECVMMIRGARPSCGVVDTRTSDTHTHIPHGLGLTWASIKNCCAQSILSHTLRRLGIPHEGESRESYRSRYKKLRMGRVSIRERRCFTDAPARELDDKGLCTRRHPLRRPANVGICRLGGRSAVLDEVAYTAISEAHKCQH